MIWILLAALGIPLFLVAGALGATLWSRHHFQRVPGTFHAKLRVVSGHVDGLKASWPRRPLVARWTHDVLVGQRGLALVRSGMFGVAGLSGTVTASTDESVHGLGPEPLVVTLILDDGASVELAAPADAKDLVVGPYTPQPVQTI